VPTTSAVTAVIPNAKRITVLSIPICSYLGTEGGTKRSKNGMDA